MGGNVSVLSLNGEEVLAQKIDLKEIGRRNFINMSNALFKSLNTLHNVKNGAPIWKNEKLLDDAIVYNGSTSFIMSNEYTDDEILKVKPYTGDIDIAVPDSIRESLFELLFSLRDKKITSQVKFIGMNRTSKDKLGNQINCIFEYLGTFLVQVDFEFLPFEDDYPTEWARFSHSSSFSDASAGVKALHHKYLIRAMIGALSVRDDIVIATPKSTWDNLKISKSDDVARMLKFSVDKGVRVAYRPLLGPGGNIMTHDGKQVWQEIPTKESDYKKSVIEIFRLAFKNGDEVDSKELWTFVGTLKLLKKYMTSKQISATADRYFEMLWGTNAQKLERDNPQEDAKVKSAGWNIFLKELKIKGPSLQEERITKFYIDY